jgi:hypothetical protein
MSVPLPPDPRLNRQVAARAANTSGKNVEPPARVVIVNNVKLEPGAAPARNAPDRLKLGPCDC